MEPLAGDASLEVPGAILDLETAVLRRSSAASATAYSAMKRSTTMKNLNFVDCEATGSCPGKGEFTQCAARSRSPPRIPPRPNHLVLSWPSRVQRNRHLARPG